MGGNVWLGPDNFAPVERERVSVTLADS